MADEEQDGKKAGGLGSGGLGGGGLKDLVKAESMIQMALILPAACLIGWVAGSALDKHFHKDWMNLVGIVLGAIAGFVQIFRTASEFLNRGDRK